MNAVTGANGFVGNVLVRELLAQGKPVRGLVRSNRPYAALEGLEFERVQADLGDYESLVRAFAGVETVFHAAGMVTIMPGLWKELYEANVVGTRNVIAACLACGVRRLVYTSSVSALPEAAPGQPMRESRDHPLEHLVGNYAKSKAMATREAFQATEKGLEVVAVMPTAVTGPFDFGPTATGDMLQKVARRKLPALVNGAYNFVDVRDVALGHILAAEKGKSGEVYILGGERMTVRELVDLTARLAGQRSPGLTLPKWLVQGLSYGALLYYWTFPKVSPTLTPYAIYSLFANSHFDLSKARNELGYCPRSVKECVQDSLDWMREVGRI
ncbi:MAG: SDR family oxidoreductase [Bacteroidia bacterium]|nr:SDR family oxidoreductase [Bacteroidia bacterium]